MLNTLQLVGVSDEVLDLCCYHGAFALAALAGYCRSRLFLDTHVTWRGISKIQKS